MHRVVRVLEPHLHDCIDIGEDQSSGNGSRNRWLKTNLRSALRKAGLSISRCPYSLSAE
jgi:hypothetical protein